MIKEEVQKKEIFSNLAKSVFFLIIAIAFWLNEKFIISFSNYKIHIDKILLSILIGCITYLLVFRSFKKNKGFIKFLFLIESVIFILVSLGLMFHFLIEQEPLKKLSELHFLFYYILIIHSIIELYIGFKLSDKKDIFASLKFVIYITILSTSFFLMGWGFNIQKYIMYTLSIVFALVFLYYLYLTSKKISMFNNNKEKSIIKTEE